MNERLKDFIIAQSSAAYGRSAWFEEDPRIKVYIRAGKSGSYTRQRQCLAICVANVTVADQHLRQGIFTALAMGLMQLGRSKGYTEFQIENASTDDMIGWCKKHELLVKPQDHGGLTWPDCYYTPI